MANETCQRLTTWISKYKASASNGHWPMRHVKDSKNFLFTLRPQTTSTIHSKPNYDHPIEKIKKNKKIGTPR